MPKDMRSWITELEEKGELLRVKKPVDPQTEMGALLYQSRDKGLLFENLKGFPGWKSLGMAPANVRHAAIAFGTTLEGLIPNVADRLDRRIPCKMVSDGPVKEVKKFGNDVDLTSLPVHRSGQKDAGPFITGGLCVTKDPDTGKRNLSFHRLQLKGKNKTGALIVPRHSFLNLRKYEERGIPMPIATFIGHHPLYYMAAAFTVAYGMDELEIAGEFLGEPVRLVKCETVDLEVPCDAEIVLEGHIPPHVREDEGPFAEFQDYYVAGMGKNPIVEWQCMTMRRDAIFKSLQNGSEVEGCVYHKVPMSAAIFRRVRNIGGFVDLKNVLVQPGIFGVAVQMTPRYYGEAKNVLMGALSSEYFHPKIAIAVDEDVNIFSENDILWALSTRVDPEKDITVIPGVRIHSMDAAAREMGVVGQLTWQRFGSKVLIDATKPPTSDPAARSQFERVKPIGFGQILLKDFL
ncbi:MAG: UbiD family decarboxylase [Deltaproteobacteria bacterium]|nr:UbiD family decarboxylase [Deltaproteobacteria bacterium]